MLFLNGVDTLVTSSTPSKAYKSTGSKVDVSPMIPKNMNLFTTYISYF